MTALARRKLGFFDGVVAPFEGLRFVVTTPATWGWALVPLLFVIAIAAALAWLGFAAVGHYAAGWSSFARVVVDVAVAIVALFLGWFLAVPCSGFALDRVVRRRERALGVGPHAEVAGWRSALRSLGAALVSMIVTVIAFVALTIVDFFAPPAAIVTVPLRVLVAALTLAWDVLDYPLAMRPMPLRSRIAWFFGHFSASLGFGLALWILFFVPGANLLLLPASVAGATKLVATSSLPSAPPRSAA